MADNLKIKAPQDPLQVNIHEEWELNYRAREWGVTKQQIIAAVQTVGTRTEKVARHLGIKGY